MSLRPYQNTAVKNVYASLHKHDRTMLQLPTAAGKTHIAAEIIKHGLRHGKRINFCVDRITLLDQTIDKFWEDGIPLGVVQADHPMSNPNAPVQIVSLQTLARRGRRNWPPADLFIVDEAHDQYQITYDVMDKWDNLKYLGLSATPFTTGLGRHWQDLVVGSTTTELMDLGYLSRYDAFGPSTPDLTNIARSGGDYSTTALEERMTALTGNIVAHYKAHAAGKKALAFTPTVAYAKQLAMEFNNAGIEADYVCGKDSDDRRTSVLESYRDGKIDVLCNCEVLIKGYDQPDIEVGILARPTRSLSLHIQMLGRLLRIAPGKDKALFLDHAGNIERLGFPDDPLPTEMCQRESGVSPTDTRQRDEPTPWNCPKCYHLNPIKTPQCEACGHRAVQPSKVTTTNGVLVKLEKTGHASKQTVYSMLNCIAQDKGYQPGWTANKYRTIFGVWPRQMQNTILTPTPEMRNWITSQNIRYARRRQ